WAHRDHLPGQRRGPAPPGRGSHRRAVGAPVGRPERDAPVRCPRRGRDRLYRGREGRGRRAAGPPWRMGRVGNLRVTEQRYRRRGVASWLLGQAADWLLLAGVDRLLDYAWLDGTDPGGLDYADYRAFLPAAGFQELTRTR